MSLRNLFAERVGLLNSTAMLITRFEVEVSLTHTTVADFQAPNARILPELKAMHIDLDSCQPLPRVSHAAFSQPLILYVEPNAVLQRFMDDMFDLAGWRVRSARDYYAAESFLRSNERYALLLTGEKLPPLNLVAGRSGLELVTLARELPHRKSLPILFFSIEDRAEEAKRAGANAFLRKPHDLYLLVDTIRWLLAEGSNEEVKK
jgi:CheY-like chemotaxis protein